MTLNLQKIIDEEKYCRYPLHRRAGNKKKGSLVEYEKSTNVSKENIKNEDK